MVRHFKAKFDGKTFTVKVAAMPQNQLGPFKKLIEMLTCIKNLR